MMKQNTIAETDSAKLNKVEKQVAGKGRVVVYTIEEKEANAFGVQWSQVDHFNHEGDARSAFKNYN